MENSITILNQKISEFNWSKITLKTNYNIIIYCVYDPVNHFDSEFSFLTDPQLDAKTLVILWQPVEEGLWWNQSWILKLNKIVKTAPYKLIFLTGCSHNLNLSSTVGVEFDVRYFPVFDIRSAEIWKMPAEINLLKSKKFVCLNSKDNIPRRFILSQLIQNSLLNQGHISYQCAEGLSNMSLDIGLHLPTSENNTLIEILNNCLSYLPMKLDDSPFSGTLSRKIFTDSYVNIVNETKFTNTTIYNTQFVTEKTFNAIANNQIFIIVGHVDSLKILKHLGYKTFDTIIDESYDNIKNNGKRLKAVSNEIVRYLSKPIESIQEDYIKVQEIIKHNRDLLFSKNLHNSLQNFVDKIKL